MVIEFKSIGLEIKDLDTGKREAVIAHATYDTIDRVKDIARKGMFSKSWKESKDDIGYYYNHDSNLAPGKTTDFWEDNTHAYTKVYHGTHTLGNDTLIMIDEGIIKKASFGYIPEKKNFITVKGQRVRELKEVQHLETSVLTKMPAHPDSKVVSVSKALEEIGLDVKSLTPSEQSILKQILASDQGVLETLVNLSGQLDVTSDLFTWIGWNIERRSSMMGDIRSQLKYNSGELKEWTNHIQLMENFCRNSKASDECIKSVEFDIQEAKQYISQNDTAGTQLIAEPPTSTKDDSFLKQLLILKTQI